MLVENGTLNIDDVRDGAVVIVKVLDCGVVAVAGALEVIEVIKIVREVDIAEVGGKTDIELACIFVVSGKVGGTVGTHGVIKVLVCGVVSDPGSFDEL